MERNIQILKYSCDYMKNKYNVSYKNISRKVLGKSHSYIRTTLKRRDISDELLDSILDAINEYIDRKEIEKAMDNTYYIFQLEMNESNLDRIFRGSAFQKSNKLDISCEGYKLVYFDTFEENAFDLETLFSKFNIDLPENYTGRSMSVSDVVVTKVGENYNAYFCDKFDWKEVPEFFDGLDMDIFLIEDGFEQEDEEEEDGFER